MWDTSSNGFNASMDLQVRICIDKPVYFTGSSDDSASEDGGASNAESSRYRIPFTLMQLAVFQTVARTGSLTGAANSLSISQPAVSKSLSHLEQVWRRLRPAEPFITGCLERHGHVLWHSAVHYRFCLETAAPSMMQCPAGQQRLNTSAKLV